MVTLDYDNTEEWQTVPRGLRLKGTREHNYTTAEYNYYYLIIDDIYTAELAIPRAKGMPRLYKSL